MSVHRKFHWKVFVSFYIVFSFLALALSGIVLYVAPPGRIANWSVWHMVALSKAQWQAVHTVFATLFLVAAGFHLYFNWKVLLAYLKSRLHEGMRMRWELGTATTAALLLVTFTIAGVPPFSTLMNTGEDIKNSWSTKASEPPVPHAELMTLEKLAEAVKVPVEKAVANLEKNGITIASTQTTVQEIAERQNLTPAQIYEKIQSEDAKPKTGLIEGGGWGAMTVQQVCERADVPVDTGVGRLKAAGVEATSATPVRELATALGKTPIDIAKIIAGQTPTVPTPGDHESGTGKPGDTGR